MPCPPIHDYTAEDVAAFLEHIADDLRDGYDLATGLEELAQYLHDCSAALTGDED
jgi:hypothetical protein